MKKAILSVLALTVMALSLQAQVKFGIKGGFNLANQVFKSNGISIKNSELPTFHAGFIVNIALKNHFYFQPGLLINNKGSQSDLQFTDNSGTMIGTVHSKNTITYLETPLNFGYLIDVSDKLKIYAQAGPFVAYPLFTKNKITADAPNLISGNYSEKLTRLDYGVNIGAGIEVSNFLIGVQYGASLANLQTNGNSNNSIKNKLFSISTGYLFPFK